MHQCAGFSSQCCNIMGCRDLFLLLFYIYADGYFFILCRWHHMMMTGLTSTNCRKSWMQQWSRMLNTGVRTMPKSVLSAHSELPHMRSSSKFARTKIIAVQGCQSLKQFNQSAHHSYYFTGIKPEEWLPYFSEFRSCVKVEVAVLGSPS